MKLFHVITTATLLSLALLFSVSASAKEFHGHFSGTQFQSAFDINDDGVGAPDLEGTGRFTQLGNITFRGTSEAFTWDQASWCSDTEILVEVYYFYMVFTVPNGDMLVTEMFDGQVCFDILDFSWESINHFQVTGGTGRFAHATGNFVCEAKAKPLNPLNYRMGDYYEGDCEGDLENIGSDE